MLRICRKLHRWISLLIAIPFIITLVTGILLATRGFNSWVQPSYPKLASSELKVSFEQILQAAQSIPEAEITRWEDVSQIDIRPSSGTVRVRSKSLWEVQIDGATGEVTAKGPRRFPLLIAVHEGAYFGPWVRYGIFLPSAVGVLFLLISGILIFFQPYLRTKNRS